MSVYADLFLFKKKHGNPVFKITKEFHAIAFSGSFQRRGIPKALRVLLVGFTNTYKALPGS